MIVTGRVAKGLGIAGLQFGTPTANIVLQEPLAIEHGVYAGIVTVENEPHQAIICYGADGGSKFEAHLLDWNGELYDRMLSVDVLDMLSNLVPWESVSQMRHKILYDVLKAKKYFNDRV